MPGAFSRVATLWQGQNLATRFLLTSAAVFVVGMSIAGAWIADRIEDGVTQNTAVSTALYFESFVAPLVQELAQGETLPPSRQETLSALVARTPLGQRVVSFKVWRQEGIIVFASRAELIGKRFPVTPLRIASFLDQYARARTAQAEAMFEDMLQIADDGSKDRVMVDGS